MCYQIGRFGKSVSQITKGYPRSVLSN